MNQLDINDHRKRIDEIDTQIIALLAQRQECVQHVMVIKKQSNQSALQPQRWDQIVQGVRIQASQQGVDPDFTEKLWNLMHEYFLSIERKELS
jgi:isochorismate pyruvate lyase